MAIMFSRSFERATLILLVALPTTFASVATPAQQDLNLNKLNEEVVLLLRAGKCEEGTEIAKRLLTLTEQRFGPDHPNVGVVLNNLASLYKARAATAMPSRYSNARSQRRRSAPTSRTSAGISTT
jgi:hypothetical protein